jgi:hypothetical protein
MFASELTYRNMASTVNLLVIPGLLASAATVAPAPPPGPATTAAGT